MAFRQPMQFFRESLKHEDQIQQQIKECRAAFNMGDRELIKNTVETLTLLVTDKMFKNDRLFLDDLDSIESEWIKENLQLRRDYDKEVKEAGCPDVVEEPNPIPPVAYFQKKFQAAANLFERRGLMFKDRVEGDMD